MQLKAGTIEIEGVFPIAIEGIAELESRGRTRVEFLQELERPLRVESIRGVTFVHCSDGTTHRLASGEAIELARTGRDDAQPVHAS